LSGFIHLYMIVVWRMTAISYAIDQQGQSLSTSLYIHWSSCSEMWQA